MINVVILLLGIHSVILAYDTCRGREQALYPFSLLPSAENVQCLKSFMVSFSYRLNQPNWTAERVTRASVHDDKDRPTWSVDTRFNRRVTELNPFGWDSRTYRWSHGHVAPACHHKDDQEHVDETFLEPTNAVPQNWFVNAVDWHRTELLVTRMLQEDVANTIKHVYVVSGPLWMPDMPQHQYYVMRFTGPAARVPIPTHLFKAIRVEMNTGINVYTSAFVIPNRPILTLEDLNTFKISRKNLETLSGLELEDFLRGQPLTEIADCETQFENCTNKYMESLRDASNIYEIFRTSASASDKLSFALKFVKSAIDNLRFRFQLAWLSRKVLISLLRSVNKVSAANGPPSNLMMASILFSVKPGMCDSSTNPYAHACYGKTVAPVDSSYPFYFVEALNALDNTNYSIPGLDI